MARLSTDRPEPASQFKIPLPVFAAIFEIHLNEKADCALICRYRNSRRVLSLNLKFNYADCDLNQTAIYI